MGTKNSVTTTDVADFTAAVKNRGPSKLMNQAIWRSVTVTSVYVLLILLLPTDKSIMQAHRLTAVEYRALLFVLDVPVILSWTAAFISYAKLRQYVVLIHKTPEWAHFKRFATGLGWLAWGLPASATVVLVLNGLSNKLPGIYPTSIIIDNYVRLIFTLVGFSTSGAASLGFMNLSKAKFSYVSSRIIGAFYLSAVVVYCLLTFKHLNLASLTSTHNPYFLPLWLLIFTITIPYVYTWFVGLLASYEITLFSSQSHGLLYRQALRFFVIGLAIIIASSVAMQYTRTTQPYIDHQTFGYSTMLLSLFHLIAAGGFVALGVGASKLKKIEEV